MNNTVVDELKKILQKRHASFVEHHPGMEPDELYCEEPYCKNCAKLTDCFGHDIDWVENEDELHNCCPQHQYEN